MPSENDPFEMLRKKLEAKKKGVRPAGTDKPQPMPASAAPGNQQKPAAQPLQQRPSALASAQKPADQPKRPAAPIDPSAPPARLQKSLFALEDIKKMARTTEKVSGDVPEKFSTHRFDTEVDPDQKKVIKKKSVTKVQKPKGFKSDRFDRG